MGAFSEKRTALGVQGYLRGSREQAFGTAYITSPTYFPIKPESLIKGFIENIEDANVINSMVKQAPNPGRYMVGGSIVQDVYPDVIGKILNWILGASSDAGDVNAGYTHTWLSPVAGVERVATSFTLEQAIGEQLATQYEGCIIKNMTIASDAQANVTVTVEIVAEDYTRDTARAASVTISSLVPYHFGQATLQLTPSGTTQFTQQVTAFELKIDMNYREGFFVGSNKISQPKFSGLPVVTFNCSIDADENFRDYALAQTACKIDLTLASGQQAGVSSGDYSVAIEIPGARLNPDTEIPNTNEYGVMDIEFDCGYGGTTTGSGATTVMFEARALDAVAEYPAVTA